MIRRLHVVGEITELLGQSLNRLHYTGCRIPVQPQYVPTRRTRHRPAPPPCLNPGCVRRRTVGRAALPQGPATDTDLTKTLRQSVTPEGEPTTHRLCLVHVGSYFPVGSAYADHRSRRLAYVPRRRSQHPRTYGAMLPFAVIESELQVVVLREPSIARAET